MPNDDVDHLPPELKQELAEHVNQRMQDALANRVRRSLLRMIHAIGSPCATHEMVPADRFEGISVSELSYHVRVLERAGVTSRDGELVTGSATPPLYVSNVSDDPLVLRVLDLTRGYDGFP